MKQGSSVRGKMLRSDTPEWTPLENLLGTELCSHFMWMFGVELADGTRLNAYKHRWTRCYFHLADDGRAFYYVPEDRYCELAPHTAIVNVFENWESCRPTPAERAALRAALRKARATLA